jgi:hypothetical protein
MAWTGRRAIEGGEGEEGEKRRLEVKRGVKTVKAAIKRLGA